MISLLFPSSSGGRGRGRAGNLMKRTESGEFWYLLTLPGLQRRLSGGRGNINSESQGISLVTVSLGLLNYFRFMEMEVNVGIPSMFLPFKNHI